MTAPNYSVDPVGQHILSRCDTVTVTGARTPAVPANGIVIYSGSGGTGNLTVLLRIDALDAASTITVTLPINTMYQLLGVKIRSADVQATSLTGFSVSLLF